MTSSAFSASRRASGSPRPPVAEGHQIQRHRGHQLQLGSARRSATKAAWARSARARRGVGSPCSLKAIHAPAPGLPPRAPAPARCWGKSVHGTPADRGSGRRPRSRRRDGGPSASRGPGRTPRRTNSAPLVEVRAIESARSSPGPGHAAGATARPRPRRPHPRGRSADAPAPGRPGLSGSTAPVFTVPALPTMQKGCSPAARSAEMALRHRSQVDLEGGVHRDPSQRRRAQPQHHEPASPSCAPRRRRRPPASGGAPARPRR